MPTEKPTALQRLAARRERLVDRLLRGEADDLLARNTRMLDDYFQQCFTHSVVGPQIGLNRNPYAMIALGGYGREEQCLHSDVDIVILFAKRVPEEADVLVQEVVYPLWDIGLEVGYALRSLGECLDGARRDFDMLTPLLDARFVCGISSLYSELMDHLHRQLLARRGRKVADWLVERNRQRHLRFGDSAYRLEPNLKEGRGGLRDYHTMLWMARIQSNLRRVRELEYDGYLSFEEYQELRQALGFIWRVRNRLHHLTGRKCDQLHFESQLKLAAVFNFNARGDQTPVERFLGELHRHMEFIKHLHLIFLYERGYQIGRRRMRTKIKRSPLEGLRVEGRVLNFVSPTEVFKRPELLIGSFEESARLKIPLGAVARRIVREFTFLVDEAFRRSPEVLRSFERILLSADAPAYVLNDMLHTSFLTHYIPALDGVVNRIQYDAYHLFPVDKHLLRTVQTVKSLGTDAAMRDSLEGRLYRECKKRRILLWAALLHDVGKGTAGGGHSLQGARLAARTLTEKGLRPKEVATVAFLVRQHLFLIKTATRRDIDDEETAVNCARRIRSVEKLKLLYLLTVADSMATGPKAWNDWTRALLRELFLKTLNVLQKGELVSDAAMESLRRKQNTLLQEIASAGDRREAKALLEVMSPRYLLARSAEDIRADMALYRGLGRDPFVWKISGRTESETRTVTICARDRPGLFAKIAGTFTLNGMDILGAQIFTWRNNIAMDIFTVTPPPDRVLEDQRWQRAAGHLRGALGEEIDLAHALSKKIHGARSVQPPLRGRAPQVVVDNASSSFFTIVEVFAYDFPGLLFGITDALFRCGLDIWVAKIATKVDQVVDVFYVRDFDAQKVDTPGKVAQIQNAVTAVLGHQGEQAAAEPQRRPVVTTRQRRKAKTGT